MARHSDQPVASSRHYVARHSDQPVASVQHPTGCHAKHVHLHLEPTSCCTSADPGAEASPPLPQPAVPHHPLPACVLRLTLEKPYGPSLRGEVGPVNLKFTIPMFSASRINLKYLQVGAVPTAEGAAAAWCRMPLVSPGSAQHGAPSLAACDGAEAGHAQCVQGRFSAALAIVAQHVVGVPAHVPAHGWRTWEMWHCRRPALLCSQRCGRHAAQILKRDKNYNPQRWVRYVTTSSSYTFRT
jgi:hypothetical protein